MTVAYDELQRNWTRLHHFGHLQSIASWDRAAMMPPKGNDARAAAMAEMDGLMHQMRTDPRLGDLLERAEDEDLDEPKRANLREIRRDWHATLIKQASEILDDACHAVPLASIHRYRARTRAKGLFWALARKQFPQLYPERTDAAADAAA